MSACSGPTSAPGRRCASNPRAWPSTNACVRGSWPLRGLSPTAAPSSTRAGHSTRSKPPSGLRSRAGSRSMAEIRHPREVFDLTGHEAAEAAFEDSRQRGRLHHAWLLTGPEGAGKATFAYRAARRLLGAPHDPSHGILGADVHHPVSRQIIARSHPDILVIERVGEDGKVR